ncbi:MAG: hypothetical protein Q9226_007422 [Calogaya cf. arnoldii]
MATPSLETLSPEIQAQIMRNISTRPALISLLRASPRFYQVFRSRKEYLLTQLAFNHFHPQIIEDVWDLAKALQLPKPNTDHNQIHRFLNERKYVDNNCLQPSIAFNTTIPLCKLGETISWFVRDYHSGSLNLLAHVCTDMILQHDPEALLSDLSATELGRLQRAFCRFETFCCVLGDPSCADIGKFHNYSARYLATFAPEDKEEIACVRDYLIRRLWGVFDAVEADAMQGENSAAIRALGTSLQPNGWFSIRGTLSQPYFMEYMMTRGLVFLRNMFEADGLKRAELVISNSRERDYFISRALKHRSGPPFSYEAEKYDDGEFDDEEIFEGDDLWNLSQGLFWANKNKVPEGYFRRPLKGLRDWGYMFWDSRRLGASGVLDVEIGKPAEVLSSDSRIAHGQIPQKNAKDGTNTPQWYSKNDRNAEDVRQSTHRVRLRMARNFE